MQKFFHRLSTNWTVILYASITVADIIQVHAWYLKLTYILRSFISLYQTFGIASPVFLSTTQFIWMIILFSSAKCQQYFVRTGKTLLCCRSPLLSTLISSFAALLGVLPSRASSFLVKKTIGKSWSRTASEAACSHLLKVK